MVYRLALSHTNAKHDAEDVFQDVFLAYISKPRSFNDEEHRKAWLIRVTINKCKSLRTSSWFRKTQPLDDSMTLETKEETDLFEYVKLLPQKYRSVIHLFYYEELSIRSLCLVMARQR